ncbi:MAG TPA: hypothetical protein VF192_11820 [Longimicrobiales bacterium]
MRQTVLVVALLGLGAAASACSSAPRRAQASRDRDVVTAAELAGVAASTAYEALQQLRPEYLRGRGVLSLETPTTALPVVYLDDIRAGGLEALHSIRVADIYEIRFYRAADATTRYGTGHPGGAIVVTTQRGQARVRR